jgi:glutamate formiminotransferase/formiminotetrahydrofolate cyclodeaminase
VETEPTVTFASLTLERFTDALASAEPVPGGGSASAIAASLAASLLAMVARLSLDRPKYAAYEATHRRALDAGEQARKRFLALADEDAAVFRTFAAALRLPRDDDSAARRRKDALDVAALDAARVPMETVRQCHVIAGELEQMAGRSNLNAASDLDVGALLCDAAARGAGANVVINLDTVPNAPEAGPMLAELKERLDAIREHAARTHEQVASGSLRDPEAA